MQSWEITEQENPRLSNVFWERKIAEENCSFASFAERQPRFSVKQRDVSVPGTPGSVMRALVSLGGIPGEGVRFSDGRGTVRIVPKTSFQGFRIISEASGAEQAEELCDFYSLKLKGLKPD